MPNTVTIQSGQTLSEIAVKHNVSVDALIKANGISNADKIKAGDVIVIPIVSSEPQGVGDSVSNEPEPLNPVIAKKYFSKEDVEENSAYSNEKIQKAYKENAELKKATADLSIDPYSGYVVISTKKPVSAEELKSLYNIPDGAIARSNNLDISWKENSTGDDSFKDYGNPVFSKGAKIVIKPQYFEYSGILTELWNSL